MRDHRLDWIWEHAMKYRFADVLNELEDVFSTVPPAVSSRNVLICYEIIQRLAEAERNEVEDVWSARYLQKSLQTLLATFQQTSNDDSEKDPYLCQRRFDLLDLTLSELNQLFLCIKLLILVNMVQSNGCEFSAPFAMRNFGFEELPDYFNSIREGVKDEDQAFFEKARNLTLWLMQNPPVEILHFISHQLRPIVVQYSRILAPYLYGQVRCTVIEYMHFDKTDDYSYIKDPVLHLLLSTVRQWSRVDHPTCQQDLLNVIKHIQDKMEHREQKAEELYHELWDDIDCSRSRTRRYFPAKFRTSATSLPSYFQISETEAKPLKPTSAIKQNTLAKLNTLKDKFVSVFGSETVRIGSPFPPQTFEWDPHREKVRYVKCRKILRLKSIPSVVELVMQLRKESTIRGDRLQASSAADGCQPSQEDLVVLRRIVSDSQRIPSDVSDSAKIDVNEEVVDMVCGLDYSCPLICEETFQSPSTNSSVFQCKQEPASSSSVLGDICSSSKNGSPAVSQRINRILLRALHSSEPK